ncbi:hypothetical protein UlMin_045688 [Ulmus minor]
MGVGSTMDRLQDCAKSTNEWGYKKYGSIRREISELQKEIEGRKTDSSYAYALGEILDMEKWLESLHNRDEIYWKQRSRMDWLAHGDRNSKVFHLKATERRRKNWIDGNPLSPYLFVICSQGLSEMLVDYERKRLFKGVSVAASCLSVSHLFFADDSLIFL